MKYGTSMKHLFTKTKKEAPSDEVSKNAQLLIRGGYISKEAAGVYAYLPLGLKVMNNIIEIIREEMNNLGAQELSMTALQTKETWETTGRFNDEVVDVWFKTNLKSGTQMGLSFTHEEPITQMLKQYISSYRDLPFSVYQFQTKFRNETRAKSGIMRCREFIMKDLYSFCSTVEEHETFYEKAKQAYITIFNRLGIGESTLLTFASGGSFSRFSHEFQTITDAGEDIVYYDPIKKIAINEEVNNSEVIEMLGLNKDTLIEYKTSESGNIFSLGTKFSDAFELLYTAEDGTKKPVIMGSYGIGPGRVMGIIAETLSDEKGLVWPIQIAPYKVHICVLGNDEEVIKMTKELTETLENNAVTYIVDDRTDVSTGSKLNDADLMGMPHRMVVSQKSIAAGGVEHTSRSLKETKIIAIEDVMSFIK